MWSPFLAAAPSPWISVVRWSLPDGLGRAGEVEAGRLRRPPSAIDGRPGGAALRSVPLGPSGSALTRSTTKTTLSALPMPSVGLPASPKASSGEATTSTREPIFWPDQALA